MSIIPIRIILILNYSFQEYAAEAEPPKTSPQRAVGCADGIYGGAVPCRWQAAIHAAPNESLRRSRGQEGRWLGHRP